ncbi:MAG: DUF3450 family protein, partial [Pseudomonadales bacterium]|nr:DUF3450 family protein [Pseudomonadales bacterium]
MTKPRGFYILSRLIGQATHTDRKNNWSKTGSSCNIKSNIKSNKFLVGTSMKEHQIRRVLIAFAFGIMSMIGVNAFAQTLDEVLGVRTATSVDGKKSQMKIDELTDQTRDLLSQFKQVMKIVDGLRVYNEQQERLIRNQEAEMAELN